MKTLAMAVLFSMAQPAFCSGPQAAPAGMTPPGRYKILSTNGRVRIPFELYRNKIRMSASVNGRPCHLTVDNGSLWDDLLFFGSPKTEALGLALSGEVVIGDPNAPNPLRADRAHGVSVGFKDVVFIDQAAVVTRYDPKLPNLWEGIEGQVSATFFKHFVVRIDFDDSTIEMTRPQDFSPPKESQVLPLNPGRYDSRSIPATVRTANGRETRLDLLVDLGGLFPLYLPLGKYAGIVLPEDAVEASLGAGLMQQKGFVGRVPTVRLGRYTLNDVVAAFTPVAEAAEIFGNTMIGLPLLQRFNVTFDYPGGRLVLEPSRSFSTPFGERY
jgi:hypothetical protein